MRTNRFSTVAVLLLLCACATGPRPQSADRREVVAATSSRAPAQVVVARSDAATEAPGASLSATAESAAPAVAAVPAVKRVSSVPSAQVQPAPAPQPETDPPTPIEPVRKPSARAPVAASPVTAAVAASVTSVEPEPARAAAADVEAGTLRGQLQLVAAAGQEVGASEMRQAVVYYVADQGAAPVRPGRYRIYTHNKQFEPESMVIPLGSTISFPNQDEILHNVFSVTPKSSFDLGIYGEGKSAEYTFKQTGLVLINCNVHHAMQANVLVIDSPYFSSPGNDGGFELKNLPAGTGTLMVWHPRAAIEATVQRIPAAGPVVLRLSLTKPRISDHLNKERKPY